MPVSCLVSELQIEHITLLKGRIFCFMANITKMKTIWQRIRAGEKVSRRFNTFSIHLLNSQTERSLLWR